MSRKPLTSGSCRSSAAICADIRERSAALDGTSDRGIVTSVVPVTLPTIPAAGGIAVTTDGASQSDGPATSSRSTVSGDRLPRATHRESGTSVVRVLSRKNTSWRTKPDTNR